MLTPTHACLANLVSRLWKRGWSRSEHIFCAVGAVLPDVPAILVYLGVCSFASPRQQFFREFLHNFFFWIFAFLVSRRFARSKFMTGFLYPLALGAIVFHIIPDMLTHLAPAHAYFWPVLGPIPGFVSSTDPLLFACEVLICLAWLVTSIKRACVK